MILKTILLIFTLFFLTSCGNPRRVLKKELQKYGYILFPNPIEDGSVGTVIGGTPKRLSYISNSETCFPKSIKGLIRTEGVALPSSYKKMTVGGNLKFDLLGAISGGTVPIGIGIGFSKVSTMSLTFEEGSIEYVDLITLKGFYNNQMNHECKLFLEDFGFIAQALRIGKMRFEFFDDVGVQIELNASIVEDLLDIGIGVDWNIENQYTLLITSPKYLGYQLGKLQGSDSGVSMYRASKTRGNKFVFKHLGLFIK